MAGTVGIGHSARRLLGRIRRLFIARAVVSSDTPDRPDALHRIPAVERQVFFRVDPHGLRGDFDRLANRACGEGHIDASDLVLLHEDVGAAASPQPGKEATP